MATMLIYPNQDVSLGHSTSGNNGYSVLRDTDDSSYIYQSVTTNDFVTLDSVFNFDSITLSNMVINSVSAIVRMQTTGSEGVNMAYMQVIGSNSNPKYFTDPTYNNFTNCSFSLTINDIGASNSTIVASETHNNIQLILETSVKKTTSSKPNFEIQISEFYIVIDYTSTETNNNNEEENITTHELSKIKLNGVVYNIKDSISRNAVAPPLATQSTNGLMSSTDKKVLDNLNPNVTTTLSNINSSTLGIINAKEKNLFDLLINEHSRISAQIRTSNLLDVNAIMQDAYISSSGTVTTSTNDYLGDFIPVSPGDVIYYTGTVGETTSSSINRRLHVYDTNQQWIKQLSFAGSLRQGHNWSTYGTIPSNGAYVRVSWGITDYNVMISVGAPTKYEPYYLTPFEKITSASFNLADNNEFTDAVTYTVNVPAAAGDVYGFKYNPIEGKIYVTTGHIASYNGEVLPSVWQSDRDTYIEGNSPSIGAEVIYLLDENDIEEYSFNPLTIPLFYQQNYLQVDNGEILTFSYYAETLAARHFTVYDGVTFGEYNITEDNIASWENTAEQINLKANINSPEFTGAPTAPTPGQSVNSDRIATTNYVQNKMNNIAPVENSNKASQDYSVGQYLFLNGQMYKVTAAIAKNTTMTVGTNIEATDVATELLLLFSQI